MPKENEELEDIEDDAVEGGKDGGEKNSIEMQKFLGGVDYPINKQKLLKHAQKRNADRRIVEAIEKLSEKNYESPAEVSGELEGGA